MKFEAASGRIIDTDRDLAPAERHVLQKLFLWESMAKSLEQFKEKKRDALQKGWNNSGPVPEGPSLRLIIGELERRIASRLNG
jgi:hypothetical protein